MGVGEVNLTSARVDISPGSDDPPLLRLDGRHQVSSQGGHRHILGIVRVPLAFEDPLDQNGPGVSYVGSHVEGVRRPQDYSGGPAKTGVDVLVGDQSVVHPLAGLFHQFLVVQVLPDIGFSVFPLSPLELFLEFLKNGLKLV